VERLFQNFQYGQAGQQIYDFIWSDFADWYVEITKQELAEGGPRAARAADTLARVFDISLRLLHPFTPFVTEEIWDHLRTATLESPLKDIAKDWSDALIIAKWPEPREPEGWEESKIADFTLMQDSIRAIRNSRAEKNIKPSTRIGATFVSQNKASLYKDYLPIISALSSTDPDQTFVYESEYKPSEAVTSLVVGSTDIYLDISDTGTSKEDKVRLEKELKEAESHIERLEKLLSSDFANKAPAPVVQKEREKLEAYKETAEKLKALLR
jgi:valyl-tRNA synthetase